MSQIEALYIFDEHNNSILEHTWTGRPPSAKTILPLYLAHSTPRPSVIYLTETNPPSIVFSILQERLLFLCPSANDIEPLLVLEFLHRVVDAFEDFLGAPLVASKIESSYDVVALLLGEICDCGTVDKTEPNALRNVVEPPSRIGRLLEGVGLPGASPSLSSQTPTLASYNPKTAPDTPAIPWRRANVRHTSNELYLDVIETLTVIHAPSGRPLTARAHGSIALNCKVSGVPDILLHLTCPGGRTQMANTMAMPVFHPCVRLARWRERPGELSFVPPDGRCVLAGYEVDLLDSDYLERSFENSKYKPDLRIPATVEVRTGLGDVGADFEVKLVLNSKFASSASSRSGAGGGSSGGHFAPPASLAARSASGTSAHPTVDDILITVPIPQGVRNLTDLRASKGEATYSPGDGGVEWRVTSKTVSTMASSMGSMTATLRCTVVGQLSEEDEEANGASRAAHTETWDYDDTAADQPSKDDASVPEKSQANEEKTSRRTRQNALLMPTSAAVSFSVKGWLASGIKVEKLVIDSQRSRGLGRDVKPYKGVKYLTVSRQGVEVRC